MNQKTIGKDFNLNYFICSLNGGNGTKMAVVKVKMQTGWIPVRILKRLIMNKKKTLNNFKRVFDFKNCLCLKWN